MTSPTTILWLRRDLRLTDNPALATAIERGGPVLPTWVDDPDEEPDPHPGPAAAQWRERSLASLEEQLARRGSRLIRRRGPALPALMTLANECGAHHLCFNRIPEPAAADHEQTIARQLNEAGIETADFQSALLCEPAELRTLQGGPYRVFTPFWRALQSLGPPPPPRPAPHTILPPLQWPASEPAPAGQADRFDQDGWQPGEKGAQTRLDQFLDDMLIGYPEDRDRPDLEGTSRLSPHLHWGELSPGQLWHAIAQHEQQSSTPGLTAASESFLRQLAWREFAHHLLAAFPSTPAEPLRAQFRPFPWRHDPDALKAWQLGQTGYPIVDAGMRQLAATGWMHNRVRMIVASFLVKDLLIHWQEGARWFWQSLTDADLANNTLGWQWVAGCGADAAPWFRIFNPVLQGRKFDPHGGYVRRWVPELARLPDRQIHAPWEAPAHSLAEAGLTLGEHYPRPIVNHSHAARRALAAYETIRSADQA